MKLLVLPTILFFCNHALGNDDDHFMLSRLYILSSNWIHPQTIHYYGTMNRREVKILRCLDGGFDTYPIINFNVNRIFCKVPEQYARVPSYKNFLLLHRYLTDYECRHLAQDAAGCRDLRYPNFGGYVVGYLGNPRRDGDPIIRRNGLTVMPSSNVF